MVLGLLNAKPETPKSLNPKLLNRKPLGFMVQGGGFRGLRLKA